MESNFDLSPAVAGERAVGWTTGAFEFSACWDRPLEPALHPHEGGHLTHAALRGEKLRGDPARASAWRKDRRKSAHSRRHPRSPPASWCRSYRYKLSAWSSPPATQLCSRPLVRARRPCNQSHQGTAEDYTGAGARVIALPRSNNGRWGGLPNASHYAWLSSALRCLSPAWLRSCYTIEIGAYSPTNSVRTW